MKLKKGLLTFVLLFISIITLSLFGKVNAVTADSYTLSIKFLRSKDGHGYMFGEANNKTIWKIYDTEHQDSGQTFYCLKGGPGFGVEDMLTSSDGIQPKLYDKHFDLKDYTNIQAPYKNALPTDDNKMKSLIWLLDHLYVRPTENASDDEQTLAEQNKQALLSAATDYGEEKNAPTGIDEVVNLTDDEIDAVQQLAVWYFTNTDDYQVQDNEFELWTNQMPGQDQGVRKSLSDLYDGTGHEERSDATNILFNYLIETAEAQGSSYVSPSSNGPAVELDDTTTITSTVKNGRKILGPYKIEKKLQDIQNADITITTKVTDGKSIEVSGIQFLQEDQSTKITNINSYIGQNFYISVPQDTDTSTLKLEISSYYFTTTQTYWSVANPETNRDQPVVLVEKQKVESKDEKVYTETPKEERKEIFDLSLRKFITQINGSPVSPSREPQISDSELAKLLSVNASGAVATELSENEPTTANKVHPKDAKPVKTGDTVLYTIRVYNEGNVDGYAAKVTDHLPAGLQFIAPSQSTINQKYRWTNPSNDGKTIETDYLSKEQEQNEGDNLIKGFTDGRQTLDYRDLQIECKVIATVEGAESLKNIAEITEYRDKDNQDASDKDRDSQPGNVNKDTYTDKSQQDDDDFEDLKLRADKEFDLSLRKFISEIQSGDETKTYDRAPKVDVTALAAGASTTATYEHPKDPIGVSVGDIVTYTIRVYNEGEIAGYVKEITDHLPPQLEFLTEDALNARYGWSVSSDGRTVKTTITSPDTTYTANRDSIYANRRTGDDKVLLDAFNGTRLDYIDVQIRCKVKDNIDLFEKITNIAEISSAKSEAGAEIVDRDSTEDSLTKDNSKPEDNIPNDNLPTDENLPGYKDTEIDRGDKYIPGQQDDDDFEKLIVQRFDLALRKFITAVEDKEVTNRVPVFTITDEGEYKYEHTKVPVEVANGNLVTYTLRIFNEGNMSGYASKVMDDLPDGIVFLPDNETNIEYRWKMYKADGTETTDVNEAEYIETDYLSKEQEQNEGDNLIKAFNPDTMTMPDYRDLKIVFRVTEPNTSDRIITNTAEITDDQDEDGKPVEDKDSEPDNGDEDEDDIDKEHIKVKYFDLSLRKWVTEIMETYKGKTTVTKTGHKAEDEPEAPVKVELYANRIKDTTVKFKFLIRVTNEGEIEGYAKEVIDYVPEGLVFNKEDNPLWREEDGKILTDQLKDKLLKPGESATVEIILTWTNNKNNLGEKVNWAEIYEDYNEYGSPDIDSIPGNNKKGEDDIDYAPVIFSIRTGSAPTYIVLALTSISMLTGGVILIKKFVL